MKSGRPPRRLRAKRWRCNQGEDEAFSCRPGTFSPGGGGARCRNTGCVYSDPTIIAAGSWSWIFHPTRTRSASFSATSKGPAWSSGAGSASSRGSKARRLSPAHGATAPASRPELKFRAGLSTGRRKLSLESAAIGDQVRGVGRSMTPPPSRGGHGPGRAPRVRGRLVSETCAASVGPRPEHGRRAPATDSGDGA